MPGVAAAQIMSFDPSFAAHFRDRPLSLAEALIIPSVFPRFLSEFLYQAFKARRAKRGHGGATHYSGNRVGDLALSHRGARGILACSRTRRRWRASHRTAPATAFGHRRGAGAGRSRDRRRDDRLAVAPGL